MEGILNMCFVMKQEWLLDQATKFLHNQNANRRSTTQGHWQKPPPLAIKVNCDASLFR